MLINKSIKQSTMHPGGGGGGYFHILAIWVCATGKGIVSSHLVWYRG